MDRKDANIVDLDVRPHLRKKLEPFQLIMDTVKTLNKNDVFLLHATFKPTPLLGVLKMKGLVGKAEQIGKDHWITTFVNRKNKHWLNDGAEANERSIDEDDAIEEAVQLSADGPKIITLDNRGLEPPKPMMRTLAAIERIASGDEVHIHNDRVPLFLIEELNSMGFPFEVEEQPDGSAKVKIRKA